MREFLLKFTATRLWLLLMIFSLPNLMVGQTVTTDKGDYYPGDVLEMSGFDWEAGETVELKIIEESPNIGEYVLYAQADSDGNIYNDEFIFDWSHFGVAFQLTATGLSSGSTDTVSFTDADSTIITAKSPGCAGSGTSIDFSASTPSKNVRCVRMEFPNGFVASSGTAPSGWNVNVVNSTTVEITSSADLTDIDFTISFSDVPSSGLYTVGTKSGSNCPNNVNGGNETLITINQSPSCSITGTLDPVCPSSIQNFSSPSGMDSYNWSLQNANGATFTSATNGKNVSVQAGNNNTSYTLNLTVTKDGCSSNCSNTVTVLDNQNPTIETLSAISVDADQGVCTYASSQLTAPDADDNCSVASVVATPAILNLGDNTVTWTVTDGAGLTATSTQTVTVVDTQDPTIETLSAISVDADQGVCTYASSQLIAPDADDNCSVASVVASPAILNLGDNTVTWTVTDGAGLTATSTQTVTVVDAQDPTIETLSAISVDADQGVCTYASSQLIAPDADDNCSVASVIATPATLNLGDNTVTWTVTDGAGLTATSTQTVTVVDTQDPTIETLSAISVDADQGVCTYASSQLTAPDADDNCSVASVVASPASLNLGENTVTWTVTDGAGLTATSTQTVTVVDTQDPTIETLSAISVDADQGVCTYASSQLTAPDADDNCSVASVVASPASLDLGENTVTWTVTDGAGRTATSTQTVTVVDTQDPTIETLSAISVNADQGVCTYASSQLTAPDADDNCSVASVVASPASLDLGENTVTWTVTDGAGRTATSTQTVTVVDTQDPTIETLSAISVNADQGVCTYASSQLTAPDADDNCSVASVVASPASLNLGENTVTWTVTDGAGLTATSTQTVTVVDTQDPTIETLSATSVNADQGVCTYASSQLTAPDADDNCSVASVVASPASLDLGENTVTWTVTDGAGRTATSTQTVTVVDTQDPTIETLSATSVNADQGVCTYASSQLTAPDADDNCSVASVVASPASLDLGENTVTWTVTDGAGLTATSTQTVTVVDTQDPTIETLSAISVDADQGVCTYASSQLTAPDADDNCSVASVVASPASLNLGENTVTWTVTDGAGRTATSTQTVTVVDTQDPTIETLSATSVNADQGVCTYASSQLTAPDADDNCSVASVVASPASLDLGENTVTWSVTDGAGRTATSTQTVTVVDTQDPTIETLSAISVNADQGVCTYASSQLTAPDADDNCSVASVVASPASLDLGENTVTWTVTDGAGRTATSTQTVTVVDTQDPTIETLSATSVNADQGVCTYASSQLTAPDADDNCSVASVVASPASLDLGENTVTWTVTDGAGRTATSTQTVTVVDTQDPTIETLSAISVNADQGVCTYASSQLTAPDADDNCSVASVVASPASLDLGENTVTWTVTDGAGRTATSTQTVTVVDTQDPTIETLSAISVNADQGVCTYASSQLTAPDADDNCSVASVVASPASLDLGENTVTWTVTDGAGRTATSTQTVTVVDTQDPTIETLSAISVNADQGVCTYASSQLTAPDADDNCSVASVVASPASLDLGENTVTWTVTDGAGRTATSTQTVTVVDTQDPTVSVSQEEVTANTSDDGTGDCTVAVAIADANFGDNCSADLAWEMTGVTTGSGTGQVGSQTFNIGTTTITYTVTDGSGAETQDSMTVTVTDDEDPTVSVAQAEVTANTSDDGTGDCTVAVAIADANFGDNCSADLAWEMTGVTTGSGTGQVGSQTFNIGTTTITYTVTDGSGAETQDSMTVTVTDDEDPTVSVAQAEVTANTSDDGTGDCTVAVAIADATFGDNCSADLAWEMAGVTTGSGTGQVETHAFNIGETTITYTVKDGSGRTSIDVMTVTVTDNEKPVITHNGNQSVNNDAGKCGAMVTVSASATDNCSVGTPTGMRSDNLALDALYPVGTTTITWTVTDANGVAADPVTQTVTVTNDAPVINSITGPEDPVQVNSPDGVTLNAVFNDTNLESASWKLMTNGAVAYENSGLIDPENKTITGNFDPSPGVYVVELTVVDACGKTATAQYEYVVVFDPNGGFVTGGGWIESPADAMASGVSGKANFGFNAKYKTGKNNTTQVDGNTNFQFKAGDFHFSSTSHTDMELVISGAKATYTGRGTVNGTGDYNFRVVAIDGALTGNGDNDKFRIKVWADGSQNNPIYDNQRTKSESSDDATEIGGGSIVIHKPNGGGKSKTEQQAVVVQTLEPINIVEFMSIAPNPVVSISTVQIQLNADADVLLEVFDYNMRKVQQLYQGKVVANQVKEVNFDRGGLPSGTYVVKLSASNGQVMSKQVIVN